jgi:hypothetical protein
MNADGYLWRDSSDYAKIGSLEAKVGYFWSRVCMDVPLCTNYFFNDLSFLTDWFFCGESNSPFSVLFPCCLLNTFAHSPLI